MEKLILWVRIILLSFVLGWATHVIGDSIFLKEDEQNSEQKLTELPDSIYVIDEEEESEILGEVRYVTATYYHPVKAQTNSNPLITASGKKIDMEKLRTGELKWIAISRDLLRIYKYGDVVRITCDHDPSINGDYMITDTMHPRFKATIDILFHPSKHHKAGKWKKVKIQKLN